MVISKKGPAKSATTGISNGTRLVIQLRRVRCSLPCHEEPECPRFQSPRAALSSLEEPLVGVVNSREEGEEKAPAPGPYQALLQLNCFLLLLLLLPILRRGRQLHDPMMTQHGGSTA